MPTCDLLLEHAIVVTMDEAFTVHPSGHVAITGDPIVGVGAGTGDWTARERVDCHGRVLLPGLVNAHTHAAMALMRGLADDLRLDVWLMGYVMPVEREFVSPDFVRLGTSLACAKMIRSGITCFADMYYFEEAVAEAVSAAGLRAVCGQTVNLIDTAPAYGWGRSERVVGRALKGRRDGAILATKCGLWWEDARGSFFADFDGKKMNRSLRPDTIQIEIENSLRRLDVDCIDLYQTHWPSMPPDHTPIADTMAVLLKLKQQAGNIRAFGV